MLTVLQRALCHLDFLLQSLYNKSLVILVLLMVPENDRNLFSHLLDLYLQLSDGLLV